MARATMATLITQMRLLIGDGGTSSQFDDNQIEAALDDHSVDEIGYRLTPAPGASTLRYTAGVGHWETGAVLTDETGVTLTPSATDERRGRWTFVAHTPAPVFVTGRRFDVHGAAVDLLRAWQAVLKLAVDFSADGATFHLSQQAKTLEALIARFEMLAEGTVQTATMVRTDLNVGGW